MERRKLTKKALLTSVISLVLCFAMLVGTTFAWFTDNVTSTGNIIKSGDLEVTMEWKDATATGAQQTYVDASEGPIFNYDRWEPGYIEAKNIKISNIGTLALKYQVNIIANGEVSKLADVIDVYFAEGDDIIADRSMAGLTKVGVLTDVLKGMPNSSSGDLLAGESDCVTIALKMQESAGNEYENLAIGTNFSVQLIATQLASEFDSFDNQYDENSKYPALKLNALTLAEVNNILNDGNTPVLRNNIAMAATDSVVLNGSVIEGENFVFNQTTGRASVAVKTTGGKIKNTAFISVGNRSSIGIGPGQFGLDTLLTEDLYLENVDISSYTLAVQVLANGKNVYFKDCTIANNIDIVGAKHIYYDNCHFVTDSAAFSGTSWIYLHGDMTFDNCHFEESVDFVLENSSDRGTVNFNGCTYGNNGVEDRPFEPTVGFFTWWMEAKNISGYNGCFGDGKIARKNFTFIVDGTTVWEAQN